MTDDTTWIRERSHEAYATNYDIVFPLDEPLAGRNHRTDPFHDALTQRGCVFQSRLGVCVCGCVVFPHRISADLRTHFLVYAAIF